LIVSGPIAENRIETQSANEKVKSRARIYQTGQSIKEPPSSHHLTKADLCSSPLSLRLALIAHSFDRRRHCLHFSYIALNVFPYRRHHPCDYKHWSCDQYVFSAIDLPRQTKRAKKNVKKEEVEEDVKPDVKSAAKKQDETVPARRSSRAKR
jgi:hypothetical protein